MSDTIDLQVSLASLSAEQQWQLVQQLIRERLGSDPQEGAALNDPDGQTYLYLVPPHLMAARKVEKPRIEPRKRTIHASNFLDLLNRDQSENSSHKAGNDGPERGK